MPVLTRVRETRESTPTRLGMAMTAAGSLANQYSASPAPPRRGRWRCRRDPTTVGVVGVCYSLERLSYLLPLDGYRYVSLPRLPLHRILGHGGGSFWSNAPLLLDHSVGLVHTFNQLPLNGPRFLVSFEAELPRYLGPHRRWQLHTGRRLIESDRCAALLAMSNAAADMARRRFTAWNSHAAEKVQIFRGGILWPTPTDANDTPPRSVEHRPGPLRLLFVGGDAFRKGLIPLVEATDALRAGGIDIRLTVISALTQRCYVHKDFVPDSARWRRKLTELPHVRHIDVLPNIQVRQLMREHDLLVLPTFDESLGWAVIEAAAEALPSIATNVFAMPELIDDHLTGRLISIPLNEDRRFTGLFVEGPPRQAALIQTTATIRDALIDILAQVAADRSILWRWGAAAREKIASLYHPVAAARALERLYQQARDA